MPASRLKRSSHVFHFFGFPYVLKLVAVSNAHCCRSQYLCTLILNTPSVVVLVGGEHSCCNSSCDVRRHFVFATAEVQNAVAPLPSDNDIMNDNAVGEKVEQTTCNMPFHNFSTFRRFCSDF